jgi:hypothetical protein
VTVTKTQAEKTLRIISKAWGRKQTGYVFFPWIDREEQAREGTRRAGYHEGPDPKNPAFKWPQDRDRIVKLIMAHGDHDLYWCPNIFEYPWRREDVAGDEHALWADLDEVDPRSIEDYPPTIAWESSPGRYQALWLAASGDFQGASWPGNENQRLTYHVDADKSGWDTTQLLRLPGWTNHKLEYKKKGKYPKGKLLWDNGPQYHPGDFSELPEVAGLGSAEGVTDALESDIEGVDRHAVLARVKLKLNRRIRDLLSAREATGDRSDALWEMERSLADAGCSLAEIVAIVRETAWNKYTGRADELRRLILEASKAIAAKPETAEEEEDEEVERGKPSRFGALLKNVKRPKFIVDSILTEGAVGFIAGEPKCYKSWNALDLALSVATGAPFLGRFRVINKGPVLYIQEEDPLPTLKTRTAKIWSGKQTDKLKLVPDGQGVSLEWLPPERESTFDPDIAAYVQKGLVISDEAWQLWLDEVLAEGMDDEPYRLMIIDTLMMTAGDVDENRAQEMTTQVFKPLKVLARKHNVAIQVVHHLGKADRARMGQRMLGSVANHAWAEDSIYLSRAAHSLKMEIESKTMPGTTWRITNLENEHWDPQVEHWAPDKADESTTQSHRQKPERKAREAPAALRVLNEASTPMTASQIADALGDEAPSRGQIWRQLQRAMEKGSVERIEGPNNTHLWKVSQ